MWGVGGERPPTNWAGLQRRKLFKLQCLGDFKYWKRESPPSCLGLVAGAELESEPPLVSQVGQSREWFLTGPVWPADHNA